jgi:hypothetical protein
VSETRRWFFRSGMAAAAGIAQAARSAQPDLQVPTMKFGNVEVGRLVLGTNPFYGFSHFNRTLDVVMRQWYTAERIVEVMRRCAACGINSFNYVNLGRSREDFQKFLDAGGKMHLVAQILGDPTATYQAFKPLAMYRQGEEVDRAYQSGDMTSIREWCKKTRDLGSLVGVGTHKPEVLEDVEEHGWDVDFYAGCIYNRSRSAAEWKQKLNGESIEMEQEIYLKSDPARMYQVMRQTRKTCFAFKILAAGRIGDRAIEQAFRTAFASLKPNDGVIVGMWPMRKDEIAENAEIVSTILRSQNS